MRTISRRIHTPDDSSRTWDRTPGVRRNDSSVWDLTDIHTIKRGFGWKKQIAELSRRLQPAVPACKQKKGERTRVKSRLRRWDKRRLCALFRLFSLPRNCKSTRHSIAAASVSGLSYRLLQDFHQTQPDVRRKHQRIYVWGESGP